MNNLFYFFLIISFMVANSFDDWVNQNKDVIKEKTKVASFQIRVESIEAANEQNLIDGQIIIGENKQFRFEMGPRTVVSDGQTWKSYDERTNQIFIQEPDKKLEKALFSWVKVNKLKALPLKKKSDGGYKINVFGKNNDIRAYLNSNTNVLDSILVMPVNGLKSTILNISILPADSVVLDIGTSSSEFFDLR